jgi:Zn-dependent metalloprotease
MPSRKVKQESKSSSDTPDTSDSDSQKKRRGSAARLFYLIFIGILIAGLLATTTGILGYVRHPVTLPSSTTSQQSAEDIAVVDYDDEAEAEDIKPGVPDNMGNFWLDGDFTDDSITNASSALAAMDAYLDLEFGEDIQLVRDWEDNSGEMRFYHLAQHYEGIPVFGRSVTVIAMEDGSVVGASVGSVAVGAVSTSPRIDQQAAREAASAHLVAGYDCVETGINLTSVALSIYTINVKPTLCWQVEASGFAEEFVARTVFVDASSGDIVASLDAIASFTGQDGEEYGELPTITRDGVQFLQDRERRINVHSLDWENNGYGGAAASSWPTGSDRLATTDNRSAVDVMGNLIVVYDFYKNYLGREQYDGNKNTELNVYVHVRGDLNGRSMGGLLWFTSPNSGVEEYSKYLDFVAHEYTHSVTGATSGLLGDPESSAINESLSDIFGEAIEKDRTGANDWRFDHDRYFSGGRDLEFSSDADEHKNCLVLDYIAMLIANGQDDVEDYTREETRFFESGANTGIGDLKAYSTFWYRVQCSLSSASTFQQVAINAVRIAEQMWGNGEITWAQFMGIRAAFDKKGYLVNPRSTVGGDTVGFVTSIVYDVSGSMDDPATLGELSMTKLEGAQEAGRTVVAQIAQTEERYRNEFAVCVAKFSDDAAIVAAPSKEFSDVSDRINALTSDGGTNIKAGLEIGMRQIRGFTGQKIIIFLSDGQDTAGNSPESILQVADEAARQGIVIYTVGFGDSDSLDQALLEEIAARTGGLYSHANTDSIRDLVASFIRAQVDATSEILGEQSDAVAQGQTSAPLDFTVPEETGDLSVLLYWPGSDLDTILVDPNGIEVDESYYGASIDRSAIPAEVVVENPKPGEWTLSIYGRVVSMEEEPYYALASFREIERAASEPLTMEMAVSAVLLPVGVFLVILSSTILLVGRKQNRSSHPVPGTGIRAGRRS